MPARTPTALAALLAASALGGCASVDFERTTQTSGTFRSTAFAFTFLAQDLPRRAIDVARENASDAGQPNTVATREWVFPYLGPLDWLLDVIGVRYVVVEGTWGFPSPEGAAEPGATSAPR